MLPHRPQKSNTNVAAGQNMARFAWAYARRGYRVFPAHNIEADGECSCGKRECASAGKHPRITHWQTLATLNEETIRNSWRDWPEANIGVKCGIDGNLTVLDIDGDVGRETLRSLELEHGEIPETPIAITGSGGAHYYFAYEPGFANAVRFAPGLDIRTEGGLVIGVGSKTKHPYEWEAAFTLSDELPPARMPHWLAEMIKGAGANGAGNKGKVIIPSNVGEMGESSGRNALLLRFGRSLKAQNMPAEAIRAALASVDSQFKVSLGAELALVTQNVLTLQDRPEFRPATTTPEQIGKPETPEGDVIKALHLPDLYKMIDEWDRQPWVWQGILPHSSLSLIVGKSETGKSTLIYALIYAVVMGLKFFGRLCEQGRVLYLAGDPMSEIVAGKTFRELGLEGNVVVVPDALVMHKDGIQQIRGIMANLKPNLVVGDTLAATVALDTDKYGQSYQAQLPLVRMAREFGPNFLMSHHSQKSAIDSYSVIDSALGSVGVAAVASSRMGTKLYKRKGEKFFTFEMSNLRIGQPIEGEWIVKKFPNGLVELDGLWKAKNTIMDKQAILDALSRETEPMAKRTLWSELRPKPKWEPFNDAIDELFAEGKLEINKGKKGAKLFSLSRSQEGE